MCVVSLIAGSRSDSKFCSLQINTEAFLKFFIVFLPLANKLWCKQQLKNCVHKEECFIFFTYTHIKICVYKKIIFCKIIVVSDSIEIRKHYAKLRIRLVFIFPPPHVNLRKKVWKMICVSTLWFGFNPKFNRFFLGPCTLFMQNFSKQSCKHIDIAEPGFKHLRTEANGIRQLN